MNFSTDRDLLAIEPEVFIDAPLVSQQRVNVSDAILSGTSLSSVSADFNAAQVSAGSVVLVGRTPLEVVTVNDANTLTVSLLREQASGAAIPAAGLDGVDLELRHRTFTPQAGILHDMLLRLVGIDPDDPAGDALNEDAVVSLSLMSRLEALGTLELVYSSASALDVKDTPLHRKAEYYRRQFAKARENSTVLLDTNGDGMPEERRSLGVIRMSRA